MVEETCKGSQLIKKNQLLKLISDGSLGKNILLYGTPCKNALLLKIIRRKRKAEFVGISVADSKRSTTEALKLTLKWNCCTWCRQLWWKRVSYTRSFEFKQQSPCSHALICLSHNFFEIIKLHFFFWIHDMKNLIPHKMNLFMDYMLSR